jgi:hypothetical protein
MTTKVPWQYAGKRQTTHATTGDQALAGFEQQEVLDAQKVSQIVKQLKGGSAMPNSEIIQKVNTSYLLDEDNEAAVGRAACEANRNYYQALADKARASYLEYQQAIEVWQSKLDRIRRPL